MRLTKRKGPATALNGLKGLSPIFVAASTALLLSACNQSTNGDSSSARNAPQQPVSQQAEVQQPAAPQPVAQQAPQEFFLKDAVTAGPIESTFDDIQVGSQINAQFTSANASEGGEYVVVKVKLKNVGTVPMSAIDMPEIKLVDANGNLYSQDVDASIAAAEVLGDNSKVLSDLNPDIAVTKVQAFEVSKKAFDPASWRLRVGESISYHLTVQNQPVAQPSAAPAQPEPQQAAASDVPPTPNAAPVAQAASAPSENDSPAKVAGANEGDCGDVASCVSSSIDAAKHENVDGLRHIASLMDSFQKPDVGNRSVANDLNTKALVAMKGNDYTGAEPLLAQAYKENPRNPEIAANYGFTLEREGKADAAFTLLNQAVALDPRRTATGSQSQTRWQRRDVAMTRSRRCG